VRGRAGRGLVSLEAQEERSLRPWPGLEVCSGAALWLGAFFTVIER